MLKQNKTNQQSDFQLCDIAIVGAGIAGMYAGERILKDTNQTKKVIILEKSSNVGGRLKSQFFPGLKTPPIEHGGMRFHSEHALVNYLKDYLQLETDDFSYELLGFILRGQKCEETNIKTVVQLIYKLKSNEINMTPIELVEYAIQENYGLTGFVTKTIDEKREIINKLIKTNKYKSTYLTQINWSTFLFQTLSAEAISLIKSTEGYNSNLDNLSASEGMIEMYRFNHGGYKFILKGFQKIVEALRDNFIEMNGQLLLKSQVIKFKKNIENSTDEKAATIFESLKKQGKSTEYFLEYTDLVSNKSKYIFCNKIILAMPKMPIKQLSRTTTFFSSENGLSESKLNQVQKMQSLKLYVHLDESDQMHNMDLQGKKIYTDGVIRMAYFLKNDDTNSKETVILIYADQAAVYEMGLPNSKYKGANSPIDAKHEFFVMHISRHIEDLIRIFKCRPDFEIPTVKNIAYSYWDEAYHCFVPYSNPKKIIKEMIKPVSNFDVFICGSAYSNKQSWVEGALLTTEYMLNKHFDLKPANNNLKKYIKENFD